tara:strand:+ start:40 stop:699 length:660 start_codon:yes stop_codon:yes gene_type:complete
MARVRQFAKDLGINYNQAKDLINKGRSRKDGGSQILEKTMKPIKANKGKITRIRPERSGPARVGQFKNILNMYQKGIIGEKEMKAKVKALREAKKKGGTLKMKKGGFPDLSGDGKTTMKDILIGRGVIEKADGGAMREKMRARRRSPSVRKNEPKEILTPFKGVLKTSKGETLRNIDGKTFLVKPNPKFNKPRMRRMRDGGAFRGCGAQVKGKKFKGIF